MFFQKTVINIFTVKEQSYIDTIFLSIKIVSELKLCTEPRVQSVQAYDANPFAVNW